MGQNQRGSLSFNLGYHSIDQKFTVAFSGAYTTGQSKMVSLPGAITLSPNAPAIYDSSGALNYTGWGPQNSVTRAVFPFANLKQPYSSNSNFLNGNIVLAYQPIKGVKLSTNLGYNQAQANNQQFNLIAALDPLTDPKGNNYFGYNTNKNWIIEPQATYDALINELKVSVLVGGSLQHINTQSIFLTGNGYSSDALINSLASAATRNSTNYFGEYRYAAVFSRISFNWGNKYLLNINARQDGSSRFGSDNLYGNFGSLGAAWIFTEEKMV